jgi:ATP-dependent Clp protease protease subunit
MASVLLSAGTRGKRFILPNSEVMIHQGSMGTQGTTPDVRRQVEHAFKLIDRLNEILAEHTGQPLERIRQDSDRDYFMGAKEAVEYGIVDEILQPTKLLVPAGA